MDRCRVYDEELGAGGLLSCGWRVTKGNPGFILLMGLVFYFPVSLLEAFAELHKDFIPVSALFFWFADTFVLLCIIIKTKRAIEPSGTGDADILGTAFRLVPRTIIATVIALLIILALSFLLIVPGIIWAVYYTFMFNAVALSNERGKKALDYSKSLVRGRWLEVLGVSLLVGVVTLVFMLVLSMPFFTLAELFPSGNIILTGTGYTITYTLALFYHITMTVYFLNIEGLSAKAEEPVQLSEYLREGLDRLTPRHKTS